LIYKDFYIEVIFKMTKLVMTNLLG